jgi:hypothetical protein
MTNNKRSDRATPNRADTETAEDNLYTSPFAQSELGKTGGKLKR